MKFTINADISVEELKELTGMDKMEEVLQEIMRSMLVPSSMLVKRDAEQDYWKEILPMFDPTKWPLWKPDCMVPDSCENDFCKTMNFGKAPESDDKH